MTHYYNRREFIAGAIAGGALLHTQLYAGAQALSDDIVVGVVGMSRGKALALDLLKAGGCRVAYVCDVDEKRRDDGAAAIAKASGHTPEAVGDFRRILDDPKVQAVAFALPAHWHAPAAILACKAGKHVYVEKPCCHNPHEGELLVEAAQRYQRVVQMGAQRRSSIVINKGMAKLQEGAIGTIRYARAWYCVQRGSMGTGALQDPPEYLNYDLWQGPAPRRPYKDNVIHYNWHWLWHYGTGEAGNNGTHLFDMGRWGLGVDYPIRVTAAGGRYRYDDDQETPDTLMTTFEFEGGKMLTWEGLSTNQPGPEGLAVGVTFYGDEGSLVFGSDKYRLRDGAGKTLEEDQGDVGGVPHGANFFDAIRNNEPGLLNCPIDNGYKSTLMAHLANIAYRTGRSLYCDGQGHILNDPEAAAFWRREYEPGWEPELG